MVSQLLGWQTIRGVTAALSPAHDRRQNNASLGTLGQRTTARGGPTVGIDQMMTYRGVMRAPVHGEYRYFRKVEYVHPAARYR
jgi:hypothetical protein